MKNILAFGASSSRESINRQLAYYAADQLSEVAVQRVDLIDFELPMYSIDRQTEEGFPEGALLFLDYIRACDGIVVSLAEHNHSYTAVFKNLLDWMSRIERKIWLEKPMWVLSTSPGGRGGANVMEAALKWFPFAGGEIVSTFSLPSFSKNFDAQVGILDEQLRAEFTAQKDKFEAHLTELK